jgi:hypothetical protein
MEEQAMHLGLVGVDLGHLELVNSSSRKVIPIISKMIFSVSLLVEAYLAVISRKIIVYFDIVSKKFIFSYLYLH